MSKKVRFISPEKTREIQKDQQSYAHDYIVFGAIISIALIVFIAYMVLKG